jgi:hypothetical protein
LKTCLEYHRSGFVFDLRSAESETDYNQFEGFGRTADNLTFDE